MTNLSELKRLAEAATSGPWREAEDEHLWPVESSHGWGRIAMVDCSPDAKFIAACDPQTVLKLVAAVEASIALYRSNLSNTSEGEHGAIASNWDAAVEDALAQLGKSDRG